jgi:hypothetical protein
MPTRLNRKITKKRGGAARPGSRGPSRSKRVSLTDLKVESLLAKIEEEQASGGGGAAKPKKRSGSNNNNWEVLNNENNLGEVTQEVEEYKKELLRIVMEEIKPKSTFGDEFNEQKILKSINGDNFESIIIKMLRMVRKVPIGTRGKMSLKFEVINPELLKFFIEFVRVKYERDIRIAITSKQEAKRKKGKKSGRIILSTQFCESVFKSALSFIFLSTKQREEVKKAVEKAQFEEDMRNLENWLQQVRDAELKKRINNLSKPGLGAVKSKNKNKNKKSPSKNKKSRKNKKSGCGC